MPTIDAGWPRSAAMTGAIDGMVSAAHAAAIWIAVVATSARVASCLTQLACREAAARFRRGSGEFVASGLRTLANVVELVRVRTACSGL